ncbi:helix-turn-helix domain-containing protein [Cytobacillus kochii]|uniref:helix-turn-helix domain-containing protein n=1 Tax=Cytobacillus kochii TaxID=859143 RepID=UPI001CD700CA|nr:helix-turn-helix domain-containing protein [Cytobacillus kochii]MCA1026666.1 helix-turn-helix domain-containing protein [Cytobacillus kochii]
MDTSLFLHYINKYITNFHIWLFSPKKQKWFLININEMINTEIINGDGLPIYKKEFLTLDYPNEFKISIQSLEGEVLYDKQDILKIYHSLYPLYTFHIVKNKDIELEKFIEGMNNIAASLDLQNLLSNILDNVASVIPGAQTSAFWQYNPVIDRIECKAFRNWKPEIQNVFYKVGESVTGKTYLDGKQRIYYSFRKANEAMKGTSKSNLKLLQDSFHGSRVKASITVPVKFGDEIKGVLGIHQESSSRKLTSWDIQLINALASQIAIAIENARLFTEIKRKNTVLSKRNEVHTTLTQLSAQNKGVKAIASELNRMIEPSVSFIDLIEEEYYSTKPIPLTIEETNKIINKRTNPLFISIYDIKHGHSQYRIQPIFVGEVCTGCLIIEGKKHLTQLENMIIERGSVFLSLELAKRHTITEVYYKKMHDYYQLLLANKNSFLLEKTGLEYNFQIKNYLLTVIVEFSHYNDLQFLETKVHHFVWSIKQRFSTVNKLVFGINNRVTILFTFHELDTLTDIKYKLNELSNFWIYTEHMKFFIGIGRIKTGIEGIQITHQEAEKAITFLQSKQKPGLLHYSDIGINRLFLQSPNEELKDFIKEVFQPLENYTYLENTLIIYFAQNRSANKTSEKLHIHINTLYQRLKKIEELTELELDNHENSLKIQLACYLKQELL